MQRSVYFPGLDTLRAYAALSVLIAHTISWPYELFGIKHPNDIPKILTLSGWDSVTLFFVLSGFLITYLLLVEKRNTGDVHVIAFYKRRVLRIWPVYYLVAGIGFIVLPALNGPTYPLYDSPLSVLILTTLLLPQFAQAWFPMSIMGHLWSIGIEEQFYAVWPHIAKRAKNPVPIFVGVVIAKLILVTFVSFMVMWQNTTFWQYATNFLYWARFEAMAIGALGAYILFRKHWLLYWIYRPIVQLSTIIMVVFIIAFSSSQGVISDLCISLVFLSLILNIATNPKSLLRLEYRITAKVGKISYGIYMYHMIVLYLVIMLLHALEIEPSWFYDPMLYGLTIGITLLVSYISFRYLETPFLRLKDRVSQVKRQEVTITAT